MIKKIIPHDIDSMLKLIFDYAIATADEIKGINQNELKQLEDKYGRFPQDYRDILLAIGKDAGRLISRDEFQLYYDQLIDLNEDVHQLRLEVISEGDVVAELPENIFFINARYFGDPYFIKTNQNNNSKVYQYFDEKEEVEFSDDSIWEVFADFILESKMDIDLDSAKTEGEKTNVRNEYRKAGFIG